MKVFTTCMAGESVGPACFVAATRFSASPANLACSSFFTSSLMRLPGWMTFVAKMPMATEMAEMTAQ